MYIPVKLDKERKILMGFEALQLFKQIHGTSIMKVNFEEEDIEDLIPLIFYVGLKHEDDELTIEQTIKLIDKHIGISGAMEKLPLILKELRPDESGGDIKNAQRAAKKK
ncbi:hypothetical protein [Alkaliphilus sp. B6464]|uniref:hypothetical protein n=1 Tax=Alkaliphilus sp. B6464 TaxID=2731219 RepID=UPI001BACA6CF|nr:hypothetical protein [Alkaliphilus sp. B6464]QUH21076.1 hypothetical protein HYG84_15110 [Alkaliphilus sp. B6464]